MVFLGDFIEAKNVLNHFENKQYSQKIAKKFFLESVRRMTNSYQC